MLPSLVVFLLFFGGAASVLEGAVCHGYSFVKSFDCIILSNRCCTLFGNESKRFVPKWINVYRLIGDVGKAHDTWDRLLFPIVTYNGIRRDRGKLVANLL